MARFACGGDLPKVRVRVTTRAPSIERSEMRCRTGSCWVRPALASMTIRTLDGVVPACQREVGALMRKILGDELRARDGVARLASRSKLSKMDVGMTRGARHGRSRRAFGIIRAGCAHRCEGGLSVSGLVRLECK